MCFSPNINDFCGHRLQISEFTWLTWTHQVPVPVFVLKSDTDSRGQKQRAHIWMTANNYFGKANILQRFTHQNNFLTFLALKEIKAFFFIFVLWETFMYFQVKRGSSTSEVASRWCFSPGGVPSSESSLKDAPIRMCRGPSKSCFFILLLSLFVFIFKPLRISIITFFISVKEIGFQKMIKSVIIKQN